MANIIVLFSTASTCKEIYDKNLQVKKAKDTLIHLIFVVNKELCQKKISPKKASTHNPPQAPYRQETKMTCTFALLKKKNEENSEPKRTKDPDMLGLICTKSISLNDDENRLHKKRKFLSKITVN